MGWSIGYDSTWSRDIGYGVPATCDHPGCARDIDRGLSYVCGGEPYGGDEGCGLYFCGEHLWFRRSRSNQLKLKGPQLCERCSKGEEPFEPTADVPKWIEWKLTDESWQQWREENPSEVKELRARLPAHGATSGSEK